MAEQALTWAEVMRDIESPERNWADPKQQLAILLALVRQVEGNRLDINDLGEACEKLLGVCEVQQEQITALRRLVVGEASLPILPDEESDHAPGGES